MPSRIANWSRGYLPHIEGNGLVQHVVFRTADALPAGIVAQAYADPGERFEAFERALDGGEGACPLANDDAASLVAQALLTGEGYRLDAWCVMPNHVHALIAPEEGAWLGDIVRRWKGPTARAINRLRDGEGPLWAREYFDRYIRDEAHYAATFSYIERNPVSAGLCAHKEEWRWSSAGHGKWRSVERL